MHSLNLSYIKKNINRKDVKINNSMGDMTQGVEMGEIERVSSLLHKIYLDITNKKVINLKEISDENDKVVNNLITEYSVVKANIGEINGIPSELNKILENPNSYYRYGVGFENSYINSILMIFDKTYMSLTPNLQNTYVKEFKKQIALELDTYWKLTKFNPRKIKKTDMQRMLLDDEKNEYIEKLICIYLDINILVMDMIKKEIYYINDCDKTKISIVLFKFNDLYEPLLKETDKSYITDYVIMRKIYSDNIKNSNNLKTILKINQIPNIKISENLKKPILKSIKMYKLKDLQEICTKNNIVLNQKDSVKKKLKSELYDELKKNDNLIL